MPGTFYSQNPGDLPPELFYSQTLGDTGGDDFGTDPPVPPDGSTLVAQSELGPQYHDEYPADTSYEDDLGIAILPVAGPQGTPPKVVALHAGFRVKSTKWHASRVGAKPQLPAWNTNNPYEFLSHRIICPAIPTLTPTMQHLYSVQGQYSWVFGLAPTDQDTYAMGGLPFDLSAPGANILLPSDFVATVLDASGATS